MTQNPKAAAYTDRCRETLETALDRTAMYRQWQQRDPGPGRSLDERFRALPSLSKADIRAHFPRGVVPAGMDLESALARGELSYVRTSGTADEALTNIWNQSWWDACERDSWMLNSHAAALAGRVPREAILASALSVGPRSAAAPLPREKRTLSRFLFLNEYASPAEWPGGHEQRMLAELADFAPDVLEANPSLLARLARFAERAGAAAFQPGLITLTYEFASAVQLSAIRRVFSSPVASSYGSTEAGYVFMECEHGRLHQNAGFCRVDVQPLADGSAARGVGRLLVTTLGNPWFPLVRFEIGDVGRISRVPCPCGRSFGLTLEAIEGRLVSVCLGSGGRLLTHGQLDAAIARVQGVAQYKLVQENPHSVQLELVAEQGSGDRARAGCRETLSELFGAGVTVHVREVALIRPEQSGKFLLARRAFPLETSRIVKEGESLDG